MLTSLLIALIASLSLLLLAPRLKARWTRRHKTEYVCDVCDSRDCLCRKKR